MGTDARDRALVEMWEGIADVEGMHAVTEVFRNSTERTSTTCAKPCSLLHVLVV